MPAIWTDDDDEVLRIYHDETNLPSAKLEGSIIVDTLPEPDYSKGRPVHHCTEADGIWIEYE